MFDLQERSHRPQTLMPGEQRRAALHLSAVERAPLGSALISSIDWLDGALGSFDAGDSHP